MKKNEIHKNMYLAAIEHHACSIERKITGEPDVALLNAEGTSAHVVLNLHQIN